MKENSEVYCRVIWSAWQYTNCKLHHKHPLVSRRRIFPYSTCLVYQTSATQSRRHWKLCCAPSSGIWSNFFSHQTSTMLSNFWNKFVPLKPWYKNVLTFKDLLKDLIRVLAKFKLKRKVAESFTKSLDDATIASDSRANVINRDSCYFHSWFLHNK